ncbi:MAG: esterase [Lachnospiraceae bacterium]|nr:esterase [Lachnospiraceae bacterium]
MEIFEFGKENATLVLIQPVDEHDLSAMETEYSAIREKYSKDFRLLGFKVSDWNKELSPWKAPAVFGKEGFGDGAGATLDEILKYCVDRSKTYIIGGYSLAGLFSLWAATKTDRFKGVAAASPSVWFPGFSEYLEDNKLQCERVYLSLGDKEAKSRNPVMADVGDKIIKAKELFSAQGADCFFEWNEGNHFKDADLRTAKAFLWVMEGQQLLTS